MRMVITKEVERNLEWTTENKPFSKVRNFQSIIPILNASFSSKFTCFSGQ